MVGVVLWIGGVAFVTTVVIPTLLRVPAGDERLRLFETIEGRFSAQARVVTLMAGLAGFYLLQGFGAWGRYQDPSFWWTRSSSWGGAIGSSAGWPPEPI